MVEHLTEEQSGHLRHFDNLSRRPRNDWSLMQGKAIGQDDFGGYRFQLAYMIYALALTHRHRLPAAPGLFRPTIRRLLDKLLQPEVWMYWRDTSRGGAPFNAHLPGLTEEWDPVVRDNIMYSAYVQSCALLHDYLFGADEFAGPGSLTFAHWSFFWGGKPKEFAYDRDSLNEHIYWQMVQNGYLGVACEPNCVFQICNQPAILGFRLHDLITGGNRAEEVVAGYERAWRELGRLDDTGHYNQFALADSRALLPSRGQTPWADAWCGALMNMWNRDFVRAHYPAQVADFLVTESDGTLAVRPSPREMPGMRLDYDWCDFGWTAAWAAEMGDTATLDGLLAHADRHMSPTIVDHGLYYPRNDVVHDEGDHLVEVEPMTGNVLLGYARLDVPDGLWSLYNEPWNPARFALPALVEAERNVEVSHADVQDGVLTLRLRALPDLPGDGEIGIDRVLGRGRRRLHADGAEIAEIDGHTVSAIGEPAAVRADGGLLRLRCGDRPTTYVLVPAL